MGDLSVSVEILLATYNGEAFLPALLSSLSAQTESGFSVLIQDDGSTDRTPEILSLWAQKDPRFIPVGSQGQHLGAKGNFCSLLSQTRADRILLCDQDDIWERDKVKKLLRACDEEERRTGAEIPILVHSDASLIDAKDRQIAPSFFRLQGWDPHAVQLSRLLVQNNVTGCTAILNRALADLVSAFADPETMFMHDWFIALTAASFGQIRFLDESLTRYRQHESNTIGASRDSLVHRGFRVLREKEKARARIALTYSNTQSFKDSFGSALPDKARETAEIYLNTRSMPKLQRIHVLCSHGYLMQSPVTCLGQMIFC